MPSFNQGHFVEEAIRSFLDQDYSNKELLFIDGGSTDITMARVEPFRDRLACCVSEPDGGQSDALQKGFDRATGDILTWLNTDDLLLPGILSEVAEIYSQNPMTRWVFGNVIWMDARGTILNLQKGEADTFIGRLGAVMSACGPSAFFHRDLLAAAGGLDQSLHYKMDTDLWFRFRSLGARYQRSKRYAWALRLHEDAKVGSQSFSDDVGARHREKIARERLILENRYDLPANRVMRAASKVAGALTKVATPEWWASKRDRKIWAGRSINEFQRQHGKQRGDV
jgi:glycosyltransferase involved in cell wall biosynthesis